MLISYTVYRETYVVAMIVPLQRDSKSHHFICLTSAGL